MSKISILFQAIIIILLAVIIALVIYYGTNPPKSIKAPASVGSFPSGYSLTVS